MQKIAILTDSASDLDIETLKKYNIKFAPFRIIYSTGEYEDKVTIHPDEVYSSLKKEIPTTSLPLFHKYDHFDVSCTQILVWNTEKERKIKLPKSYILKCFLKG